MNRRLVLAAGLVVLGCGRARHDSAAQSETSANFDLEDVRPVPMRISGVVQRGFGEAEVEQVAAGIAAQPVEAERADEFAVSFEGTPGTLRIVAVMDDGDAPDLSFSAPAALVQRIDSLIGAYLTERGK